MSSFGVLWMLCAYALETLFFPTESFVSERTKRKRHLKKLRRPLEARNSAHGGVGERLPNVSDGTEAVSAREVEMGLRGV